MRKVLLTAGPIPACLDSVKFITNRFKGGLALKTAEALSKLNHDVHLICWKHSELKTSLPIIYVDDVLDYYQKVLAFEADAYILAAAVANLMPSKPYEGKFPSHQYQVGEKFNIEFEIAPRVIDQIKKKCPRSTLIGYKLFDGTEEELIAAGRKTLFESKANLVFANHPSWAKSRKIALTSDGASFNVNFDEHIKLIDQVINASWYRTEIVSVFTPSISEEDQFIINHFPQVKINDYSFGTFAIRKGEGFITTTRSKADQAKSVAFVQEVNYIDRLVTANEKTTLNAPLLGMVFDLNPQINFIIHGHNLIGRLKHNKYEFPGTEGDLKNAISTYDQQFLIELKHHGYLAGFSSFEDCKKFLQDSANRTNWKF